MGMTTQYTASRHLGVVMDIPPEEVGDEFWTGGINMTFGNGSSERAEGYASFAAANMPPGKQPIFSGSVGYEGIQYWVWMTTDEVWVTNGSDHFDITPAGGLIPCNVGDWTFDVLGGIPVFNNNNNPPMWWDLQTANPAEVLPGWPADATCVALRAVKYHLVALNITEAGINYPSQVWWSEGAQAGAVPQEWIPTAENDAGDTILGDTPSGIVDGWQLRDQLIIYKNSSTYTMQYIAGQYVYSFRKLFPTVGMQTINCACEIDGHQYVFTGEDVIKHDGQNFISVVDRKVLRTLVRSVDSTRLSLCCIVPRVVERQVWVCFPITGIEYLGNAYVLNTDDLLGGFITLPSVASVNRGTINPAGAVAQEQWDDDPDSWNTDTTIWTQSTFSPTNDSLMMTAPITDRLYAVGIGSSADGAPIASRLERLSMRVGKGIYHSVVTQIAPKIEGQPGDVVNIRLGYQNYFHDPITWLPAQPFTIGTTKGISQIIDGRYLSIEFTANTVNAWKLFGYWLKMKEAGEY